MDQQTIVREARHQAGLTQKELAKLLGVSTRAVQHWEGGTTRISLPTLELLRLKTQRFQMVARR